MSHISIFLHFLALAGPPDLKAPLKQLTEAWEQIYSLCNCNQLKLEAVSHDENIFFEADFHENEFSGCFWFGMKFMQNDSYHLSNNYKQKSIILNSPAHPTPSASPKVATGFCCGGVIRVLHVHFLFINILFDPPTCSVADW